MRYLKSSEGKKILRDTASSVFFENYEKIGISGIEELLKVGEIHQKKEDEIQKIYTKLKLIKDIDEKELTRFFKELKIIQELVRNSKDLEEKNKQSDYFKQEYLLENILYLGVYASLENRESSNQYEITMEAYSQLLYYVLFEKNIAVSVRHNWVVSDMNKGKRILQRSFEDLEIKKIISEWQYGNIKVSKKKGYLIIKTSDDILKARISQNEYLNRLEVKELVQVDKAYVKKGSQVSPEDLFLNKQDEMDFITDFFNIKNIDLLTDEYYHISLRELFEVWYGLKKLSNSYLNDISYSSGKFVAALRTYTYDQLKDIVEVEIENEKFDSIINLLAFGIKDRVDKSRDLFSNPLIKLSDNRFTMIPWMVLTTNISDAILSKKIFPKKGELYEEDLRNLVADSIKVKVKKFKKNDYDIDLAFALDDTLYLCEIKNFFPTVNVYDYYQLRVKIKSAIEQLRRTSEYWIQPQNLEILTKKLEIDEKNITYIKKLILCSNWIGDYVPDEDILIIEGSYFESYFEHTFPEEVLKDIQGDKIILLSSTIKYFKKYKEHDFSAIALNDYLKNQPWVEFNKSRFQRITRKSSIRKIKYDDWQLIQDNVEFIDKENKRRKT